MRELENVNIDENPMIQMNKIYEILKAVVKIELNSGIEASGFFIQVNRNNKHFYVLMTNHHVISSKIVQNKEEITIKYENKKTI